MHIKRLRSGNLVASVRSGLFAAGYTAGVVVNVLGELAYVQCGGRSIVGGLVVGAGSLFSALALAICSRYYTNPPPARPVAHDQRADTGPHDPAI